MTVVLHDDNRIDDNRIDDNTAAAQGGGAYLLAGANLQLHERSRVTLNNALGGPTSGGDIFFDTGPGGSSVQILDQAVVTGNSPDNCEPTVGTCT